jgi:glutathione S-transferase
MPQKIFEQRLVGQQRNSEDGKEGGPTSEHAFISAGQLWTHFSFQQRRPAWCRWPRRISARRASWAQRVSSATGSPSLPQTAEKLSCSVAKHKIMGLFSTNTSSALTAAIPSEYGPGKLRIPRDVVVWSNSTAVLGVALGFGLLTVWQMELVGKARKRASVPYPLLYATAEEMNANPAARIFNCCQRAHANTLENMPNILLSLFIAGLGFPRAASACGIVAILGRIVYTLGYSSGDPKKRLRGSFEYLGRIPLLGMARAVALSFSNLR